MGEVNRLMKRPAKERLSLSSPRNLSRRLPDMSSMAVFELLGKIPSIGRELRGSATSIQFRLDLRRARRGFTVRSPRKLIEIGDEREDRRQGFNVMGSAQTTAS